MVINVYFWEEIMGEINSLLFITTLVNPFMVVLMSLSLLTLQLISLFKEIL